MEQKEIGLQVLLLAAIILLIIESVAIVVIPRVNVQPLLIIGAIRIAESGCLILLFKLVYGLESIGILKNKFMPGLRKGFVWSACFGIGALLILGFLHLLDYDLLHFFPAPVEKSSANIFLLLLVGGLISPVTEEIFFRGIVYGYLRKWGLLIGIMGSTTLFAMAHHIISGLSLVQIIGGLVFATAYELEKNLLVPITIHVLGNIAIFTISLLLAP